VSPDDIVQLLEPVRNSALLPMYVLAAFVVAGALFFPVWLVIFQTGLLVPAPLSCLLAFAGAGLSASLFFSLGRLARAPIARRLARRPRVLHAIEGAKLEHIIALRLVPVLPFTLTNLAAGALGVHYRTFIGGTLAGMAPGILAVTLLGDRAVAVFRDPSPASIAMLAGCALALVAGATTLRRVARTRSDRI
jgi:phospholipase D1/2